jgi:transposase
VKIGMDDSSGTSIIPTQPRKCYRSLEERRQIVEEALVPGISLAAVARAHGVKHTCFFIGESCIGLDCFLPAAEPGEVRLLLVRVQREGKSPRRRHAEPAANEDGTVEAWRKHKCDRREVNREVLRVVLRCLVGTIALPTGTRIWIGAGVTDLRRGFTGLSAMVQTKLEADPFSGHLFVFRSSPETSLVGWTGAMSIREKIAEEKVFVAEGGKRCCGSNASPVIVLCWFQRSSRS